MSEKKFKKEALQDNLQNSGSWLPLGETGEWDKKEGHREKWIISNGEVLAYV